MPSVLNRHRDQIPYGAVYIGRGSRWGNPFIIGRDGSREEVVEKYCHWICDNPDLLRHLSELTGKDLVCYCSPKLCHGHALLILANEF